MRTSGILCLALDRLEQLLGVTICCVTRMSPSLLVAQLVLHVDRLVDLLVRGAVLLDQHLADARAELEVAVAPSRDEDALARCRRCVVRAGTGTGRARCSTWPMVSPLSSPPPVSVHAGSRAARAGSAGRHAGRPSGSGSGCSGVGQRQRAELVEAQRHGRARRRHCTCATAGRPARRRSGAPT